MREFTVRLYGIIHLYIDNNVEYNSLHENVLQYNAPAFTKLIIGYK